MGADETGLVGTFTDLVQDKVVFLRAGGETSVIDLQQLQPAGASYMPSPFPVLIDINRDGLLEVMLTYGPNLVAFHAGGGLFDGFPVLMPAASFAQPVVVKLSELTSRWEVLIAARDGYIHGYGVGGPDEVLPLAGFPLAVGADVFATPLVRGNTLYAIDRTGNVKAWTLNNLFDVWWGQQNANTYNTSFVEAEEVHESTTGPTQQQPLCPRRKLQLAKPDPEWRNLFPAGAIPKCKRNDYDYRLCRRFGRKAGF